MATLLEGAGMATVPVSAEGFQEVDANVYFQIAGKIAGKFELVSKEEMGKALEDLFNSNSKLLTNEENFNDDGSGMHGPIVKCFVANATPKLPRRATKGSAGYDFYAPFTFTLLPGGTIKIPTGIKCRMNPGWVLKLYPRSSLGFKHRISLDNTVGIIDQDYYNNPNNEGHIFIKITYNKPSSALGLLYPALTIHKGDAFAQGLFVEYGITEDDETTDERIGGMGSTNKG